MINSIKARTPILALILFVLAAGYTFAQNKVVVVPLGSDNAQWVLVRSDGTIAAQSGGIIVNRTASGLYFADFGRDVTGHTINASAKWPSSSITHTVAICGGVDNANEQVICGTPEYENSHNVIVLTFDFNGARVDSHFYLSIQP